MPDHPTMPAPTCLPLYVQTFHHPCLCISQFLDDSDTAQELKRQLREQHKHIAVFPCRMRILPQCIFNARDPIVMGVVVEDGILKQGVPLVAQVKGDRFVHSPSLTALCTSP